MILELITSDGQPLRLSVSRLVIRDQATATILGVALEVAPGQYLAGALPVLPLVATASEQAAFRKLLDVMKIRETTIVTELSPGQLEMPTIQ